MVHQKIFHLKKHRKIDTSFCQYERTQGEAGEVRDKCLESQPEPISDALAVHHSDDIRIGAWAIQQDRGIHHAQAGQAMHTPVLVHHRHRIGYLAPSCRCGKCGASWRRDEGLLIRWEASKLSCGVSCEPDGPSHILILRV